MSFKSVVKFLDNKDTTLKIVGQFVTKAVGKSALLMEQNVKTVARTAFVQRTGHLGRSIRANYKNQPFGKAEIQINPIREGEDINYALYLEYGTKYITPRAFIRKGVGISKKGIKNIFAEEAKKQKDIVRGKPK